MASASGFFHSDRDYTMKLPLMIVFMSSVVFFVSSIASMNTIGLKVRTIHELYIQNLEKQAQDLQKAAILDETKEIQVLGDSLLLTWCVMGAIVGAWIYIVFVPDTNNTIKRLTAKYFASVGCGITMTPMVMSIFNLEQNLNNTAGAATCVAFGGTSLLVGVLPLVVKWGKNKVTSAINGLKTDEKANS